MKIEQLLEKKEQLQLLLLRELVLQGGKASSSELREKVNLSKSAFDQYLEDIEWIGSMMRKKVEVNRAGFQVILELGDDTSLEQICLF